MLWPRFSICLVLILLLLAFSGGPTTQTGSGYCGAPCETDGRVCGDCHYGGPSDTTTTMLTFQDAEGQPTQTLKAGHAYTVLLQVNGPTIFPRRYGAQLTALDQDNNDIGTWSELSANLQLAQATTSCGDGSRTYVEHSSPSVSNTFGATWTAPLCPQEVTFYHIGNTVNTNGNQLGDNGGFGDSIIVPIQYSELALAGDTTFSGMYSANAITFEGLMGQDSTATFTISEHFLLQDSTCIAEGAELAVVVEDCP